MDKALIIIWPYYNNESLSEESLTEYNVDVLFGDNMTIGGEIFGDVILDQSQSPYVVTRSIFIP